MSFDAIAQMKVEKGVAFERGFSASALRSTGLIVSKSRSCAHVQSVAVMLVVAATPSDL
jgi:hypothetical protein